MDGRKIRLEYQRCGERRMRFVDLAKSDDLGGLWWCVKVVACWGPRWCFLLQLQSAKYDGAGKTFDRKSFDFFPLFPFWHPPFPILRRLTLDQTILVLQTSHELSDADAQIPLLNLFPVSNVLRTCTSPASSSHHSQDGLRPQLHCSDLLIASQYLHML